MFFNFSNKIRDYQKIICIIVFYLFQVFLVEMLSFCYNNLLCYLFFYCLNLDSLFQFWLILNSEGCMDVLGSFVFDFLRIFLIFFSFFLVVILLEVFIVILSFFISIWVLVFQSFILVVNQRFLSYSDVGEMLMIVFLLFDVNLMSVIKKFLLGIFENGLIVFFVQFFIVCVLLYLYVIYLQLFLFVKFENFNLNFVLFFQVGFVVIKVFYEFLLRFLVKCF